MTLTESDVNDIVDSLHYWPKDTKLYSTTGCKRVSNKLDLYQEDIDESDEP